MVRPAKKRCPGLQRALGESVIVVKGGASNKAFLLEMLGREEVQSGNVDVGWLDRLAAEDGHLFRKYADVALVQAAIDAYDAELADRAVSVLRIRRARPPARAE